MGLFSAVQLAHAGDYDDSPQVAEFVSEMTRDYGFAGEQLMGVFREVQRKQSILDAISRPAERVKPWKDYRPMFITDARIARGVDFWRQHEAVLARAEQEYGVPAQYIVSIIGVETFFGRNTGNYRVIDALSTLGFDYPRVPNSSARSCANTCCWRATSNSTRSPSRVPTLAPWVCRSSCRAAFATTPWISTATATSISGTTPTMPSAAWPATSSAMAG